MPQDLFHDFFPPDVLTFISTRSIDFSRNDQNKELSKKQNEYFRRRLGLSFSSAVNVRQVHGSRVIHAVGREKEAEADAIVTQQANLPLVVRTADCLPIFLFDEKHRAIGIVHAGWRGTREKIICQTLSKMYDIWKTEPEKIKAALGPAICKDHYEVGKEFLDFFPDDVEKCNAKCYLDLKAVNKKQLKMIGVKELNIFDCGICTYCDKNYFSYRREGKEAGRMISLIMLKGKEK